MAKKDMQALEQGSIPAEETKTKNEIKSSQIQDQGPSRQINRQVGFLVGYYMLSIILSIWFLFDVWSKSFVLFRAIGIGLEALEEPLLRTIGFTIVGGFLGNILYQIRVLFHYHTTKRYDPRWFGKYLSSPWEASGMALIVLSLIRGGVALYGGSTGTDIDAVNNFAAIGTGALVGFGMRDVVGWLGNLVQTMFTISDRNNNKTRSGTGDEKS